MPAPRSRGHRQSSASSVMLSINASFKSGTALTYFSWRKIVSNFSAKSNYFLMSPIRQIKSLTLRAALLRFRPSAEKCASHMLLLKRQEPREFSEVIGAVLYGDRFANSIKTFEFYMIEVLCLFLPHKYAEVVEEF